MTDNRTSNFPALRVAILYGSTREGRLCDRIADWIAAEVARQHGFAIDRIDPLLLELPPRQERNDGDAVKALRARIGAADAFVVVTPEYNHGYPAALKQLIDSVSGEWQAKPVAFVSYGGVSGGLRAVEQLRQHPRGGIAGCVRRVVLRTVPAAQAGADAIADHAGVRLIHALSSP